MESFFTATIKGAVKAPSVLDPSNTEFPAFRLFTVVRAAEPGKYDTAGSVGFIGNFSGDRYVVWLRGTSDSPSPGYDRVDVLYGAQLRFLQPYEVVELRNE